jgi:K+-transporting ATPase ATPase A chain
MTGAGVFQIVLFLALIVAAAKPLGAHMARVFEGGRTFLHPLLGWLERLTYRAAGIQAGAGQRWTEYTAALLAFSLFGFLLTYLLQRLQGLLPLNPQGFGAANVPPDLAFNTATSFVTNTNWQAYAGESTLSYFVQMAALTVQNFASAAAGMAVAVALIRGFARQRKPTIGNFWVDATRAIVYVLLPLSVVVALALVSQGVVQNLSPYTALTTVEGAPQVLAGGPVASQEAIKQLGTNGGGFFNANSAHPFENPTPTTNLLSMLLIFLIPGALTCTFGCMVGDTRQGWAILAAFSVMFLIGVFVCYSAEQAGNPLLTRLGVEPAGNMEGKEVRFGVAASALYATVTTGASCGAVNAMHDSFTPIGGLVPLFNMMTGEVIFGGVGAGLYGILLYAILAVFIAGLMVGRTPEYLGKKIEQKEVKMAMLAVIATAFSVLVLAAAAVTRPGGLGNAGPHGFSELLYAYTSAAANNGSAFAGLAANTPWYNLTLGLAMWAGRFLFLIPLLAVAGSLAAKHKIPSTAGTFPTHGPLFVSLLVGTVLIVGALTFFPALCLGPVVEHYLMLGGKLF